MAGHEQHATQEALLRAYLCEIFGSQVETQRREWTNAPSSALEVLWAVVSQQRKHTSSLQAELREEEVGIQQTQAEIHGKLASDHEMYSWLATNAQQIRNLVEASWADFRQKCSTVLTFPSTTFVKDNLPVLIAFIDKTNEKTFDG